jgi:hypothetical protein
MSQSSSGHSTAFQQAASDRFGLVPNFLQSAAEAPETVERLWDLATGLHLDNPIPSLFKERLFVYLSRLCEVRYCITRHCGFLIGRGHASGDVFTLPISDQAAGSGMDMPASSARRGT